MFILLVLNFFSYTQFVHIIAFIPRNAFFGVARKCHLLYRLHSKVSGVLMMLDLILDFIDELLSSNLWLLPSTLQIAVNPPKSSDNLFI